MPIDFRRTTLDNGLEIIAEVDAGAPTAAAGFFVKTGARDETPALMGVSHYLEHMMFKGSADLTAEQINRGFDDLGARNNAYTSHEVTCFYAQVLPERLSAATELIARMMRPALRQDDFDTEKGVILEEIAMYKDEPFWVLYEAAQAAYYADHPLAHRVLGTVETITDLQRDDMAAYFDDRYSADNTVLALAGRVDFDAIAAEVAQSCGSWQRTGADRTGPSGAPSGKSLDLTEDVSRGYYLKLAPAPAAQDPDRYAASLLAQLLGARDNSRLHWSLIEPGLAEDAQASFDPHDGDGMFMVYASGDPERLDEIGSIIDHELAALADGAKAEDLERLRSKALTGATLGGERPGDRMQRLGRLWTAEGDYRPLDEDLERLAAVTLDDIRRVANDYFGRPSTTGTLRPNGAAAG
ncbi:MAG: pitrilysin family protein [Planctomycetota bacterium]